MSYYLTIDAHKEGLAGDALKAFEAAAVDKVRVFVSSLEGVQHASMNTSTLGGVNLLEAATESVPAPEASAGLAPATSGEAV